MKIYSIKYTDNPDLPKAKEPIVIPGDSMMSVAVPFPTEGSITRVIVKETDGNSPGSNCDVYLLDSQVPFPAGEYASGSTPADDIELYQILEKKTVTAGSALVVVNEEYGFPYHNQDGTFTDNQRYIYLILEPDNADSTTFTTWDVALTARTEVG